MREAALFDALEHGSMARAALGDDVVDHYLNYGRVEQRLFGRFPRRRLVRRLRQRS